MVYNLSAIGVTVSHAQQSVRFTACSACKRPVFVETSTHTYSLSEEGFGYNSGRLKVQRATRLVKIPC